MPIDTVNTTTEPKPAESTTKSHAQGAWLPITLLAVSTAALAVPLVLVLRHGHGRGWRLRGRTVPTSSSPPPPRRHGSAASVGQLSPIRPTLEPQKAPPRPGPAEDGFNGGLYTLQAFGLATLLVGAGAASAVWGVRRGLGVDNTREFAERMRGVVGGILPVLVSRMRGDAGEAEAELREAFEGWGGAEEEEELNSRK